MISDPATKPLNGLDPNSFVALKKHCTLVQCLGPVIVRELFITTAVTATKRGRIDGFILQAHLSRRIFYQVPPQDATLLVREDDSLPCLLDYVAPFSLG